MFPFTSMNHGYVTSEALHPAEVHQSVLPEDLLCTDTHKASVCVSSHSSPTEKHLHDTGEAVTSSGALEVAMASLLLLLLLRVYSSSLRSSQKL